MLTSTVKEIPSSRMTSSIVIASNARSQTFLSADLAGYTALTEAHGDEAAADAADAFRSAVRRILPDHTAEEIKRIGDAVMIRIPDAGTADLFQHPEPYQRCGHDLLASRNAGLG